MDKMEMLDSYLEGELSTNEMQTFEAVIANDDELSREYKLHQDMSKALLNDKADDFRKMLDKAHLSYEKKDRKPVYYKIAAAVIVLIAAGGLMFLLKQKDPPAKLLADKFYQTYQPLNGVRSEDPNQDKLLASAFQAYDKGDYVTSSRHFESLLKINPENNQVRFYLAISYMEDKSETNAIKLLQEIIDTRDVYYLSQSEWYLGICYLWLGRKEEAILPFERLAKKNGYYQQQAKKMLAELSYK